LCFKKVTYSSIKTPERKAKILFFCLHTPDVFLVKNKLWNR
jgi:hypothetical protein